MASFNSDMFSALTWGASPVVKLKPSDYAGRLRISRATYTTNGDASGSVWNMTVIPWNARVLFSILSFDALTGAVTATLDDKVTAGRWGTATTMAAAGNQTLFPTTTDATTVIPTTIPAASAVAGTPIGYIPVCLTTGGAAVTGAQKIHLEVYWTVD